MKEIGKLPEGNLYLKSLTILNNRNRIKKKDWINKLKETNDTVKETNLSLREKLAELELEYQQLQSLMIPHTAETHMISMIDIAPSADLGL